LDVGVECGCIGSGEHNERDTKSNIRQENGRQYKWNCILHCGITDGAEWKAVAGEVSSGLQDAAPPPSQ